jgi:hypothetical protein
MTFMKIFLLSGLGLWALIIHANCEDWTVDGKTFHNVVPGTVEIDKVHVTYDGGIGTVPLASLTPDLQKRFHYDPINVRAQELVKQDEEKSDWEKINDDFLVALVSKVKEETDSAKTGDQKLTAQVHQMQLVFFHNTFGNHDLNEAQKSAVKEWAECVINRQVCIGMPKDLIQFAWGTPDSDTVSTSGDGNDIETMTFGHWSSLIFISDGVIKNITQTQTANN